MSERTDERARSADVGAGDDGVTDDPDADAGSTATGARAPGSTGLSGDVGADALDPGRSPADIDATSGERSRLGAARERAGSVFSGTVFVASLAATLVGATLAAGAFPVGSIGALLGILVVAGLVGGVTDDSHYVETGAAGAVTGALGVFLNFVVLTFVTGGIPVAIGGVVGGVGALLGHYAGRDLRDGLTRDL